MGIQIIIDGQHSTDILAELKILTEALHKKEEVKKIEEEVKEEPKKKEETKPVNVANLINHSRKDRQEEILTKENSRLYGFEHRRFAEKMIKEGAIDHDIFPKLNKKHQEMVRNAIFKEEEDKSEPIFNEEISIEKIKYYIQSRTTKEENGKRIDIPEKYAVAKKILQKYIPDNVKFKLHNVPKEKLNEFYLELTSTL